jgi:hypothetical protein
MQGGGHLLIGAMPKSSGGISLLHKEPIELYHLRYDVLEQLDAHLKTPPKNSFRDMLDFH